MPAPAPEYSTHSKHPHRRKTPSFSSSLLDSIFRSIDDNDDHQYDEFNQRRTKKDSMQQQQQQWKYQTVEEEIIPSLGRQIMMEKWADNRRNRSRTICSYSSSSASSSGATFSSSSETESVNYRSYTPPASNQLRRHAIFPTPAEIATTTRNYEQTPKRGEGKFMRRTKQRAMKIYGDLKKVKQPISPGGRISNFLNSILGSRNLKKSKLNETKDNLNPLRKSRSVKSSTTTTCATFSRSCLSKSPPPLRDGNCSKRSVRFNVIVDEDSRTCGDRKNIHECNPSSNRYAMRDGIWSYKSKNVIRKYLEEDEDEDEDEDDDIESCSSSDLFELESVVGIGVYRGEELPVFGTTNLRTNLAIANGRLIR